MILILNEFFDFFKLTWIILEFSYIWYFYLHIFYYIKSSECFRSKILNYSSEFSRWLNEQLRDSYSLETTSKTGISEWQENEKKCISEKKEFISFRKIKGFCLFYKQFYLTIFNNFLLLLILCKINYHLSYNWFFFRFLSRWRVFEILTEFHFWLRAIVWMSEYSYWRVSNICSVEHFYSILKFNNLNRIKLL